jgi:hypothetical protein
MDKLGFMPNLRGDTMRKIIVIVGLFLCLFCSVFAYATEETVTGMYVIGYTYNTSDYNGWMFKLAISPSSILASDYAYVAASAGALYEDCIKALLTAKTTSAMVTVTGERVTPSSTSTTTAIQCYKVVALVNMATLRSTICGVTAVEDQTSGYVLSYVYNANDIEGWLFSIGDTATSTIVEDYIYIEDNSTNIDCVDALLTAAINRTYITGTGARIIYPGTTNMLNESAIQSTKIQTPLVAIRAPIKKL